MEKAKTLRFAPYLLFVALTLIFFRYAIFVPEDSFLSWHQASDLLAYFQNVVLHSEWLKEGFIPLGDYWMPFGGGYPAVPHNQLVVPGNLLVLGLYTLTGNFFVSLRIVMPLIYFATLVTAYWYGTVLFKRRDASIVLAVAYTFSMYAATQLEHLEILGAQPLVLLTLIFLEKALAAPKPKYIVLTSVFWFTVYLSQLYPFYFVSVFILARIIFHLITAPRKTETLQTVIKTGLLLVLLSAPFLLTQLRYIPSAEMQEVLRSHLFGVHQAPFLYFYRSTVIAPPTEPTSTMYLGLLVVILFLIPIILQTSNRMYILCLSMLFVTIFYAVGQYSFVNIASWVQEHVPLSFFLRMPSRAMLIGSLCLAIGAAMGFALLSDKIKYKSLFLGAVIVIIFADLTIGYEPPAPPLKLVTNEAYQFLERQEGDFRIIEIPTTYHQMMTTGVYTGHDVLSTYELGYGYFESLYAFTGIHWKYLKCNATAQEAALYGVKYVVINTDPKYYNELHSDLKYYCTPDFQWVSEVAVWIGSVEGHKLVYNKGGYAIYENLLYRGTVFSDEATLHYAYVDPNTLVIDSYSDVPASIYVSQGYSSDWVANVSDGKSSYTLHPSNHKSIQRFDVPAGNLHIILHYQRYEEFFLRLAVFHSLFIAVVICLLYFGRRRVHA